MDPLAVAMVVTVLAVVIARIGGQYWLIRRYQADRMSARRARWLIGLVTIIPYALLFLFAVLSDQASGGWHSCYSWPRGR